MHSTPAVPTLAEYSALPSNSTRPLSLEALKVLVAKAKTWNPPPEYVSDLQARLALAEQEFSAKYAQIDLGFPLHR
jgi:hypothetical protein